MSIRHAILGLLADSPMHGYQIAGELERRIGGGRYNSAQIYHSLRALADAGLILETAQDSGAGRDRRTFDVTVDGRRDFQRWLRAPLVLTRPARDDAVVKLVFLGLHDPRQLIGFLERLRRQHLRRLAGTQVGKRAAAEKVDQTLLTELAGAAFRFREEAELQWIEHCLVRLRALLETEPPRGTGARASATVPRSRVGAGE